VYPEGTGDRLEESHWEGIGMDILLVKDKQEIVDDLLLPGTALHLAFQKLNSLELAAWISQGEDSALRKNLHHAGLIDVLKLICGESGLVLHSVPHKHSEHCHESCRW